MEPGDVVAGRFALERLAGSGGMGEVYRARDLEQGGLVAVKLVAGDDEQLARRFAQEAEVLARLEHPGIVRHVAHGLAANGQLYLVMEWLEGEDLAARLQREGLTVVESVTVVSRAADAIGVAHAHGVVHRDVKPSNLFLVDGSVEQVRVLDFGIAHFGGLAGGGTRTGALVGTPAYMAPEQARGDEEIDARADVFALGALLFECLTGGPPFASDTIMGLLAKVLLEEAPRVRALRPDVPPALDELLARMLAKEPEGRPRDGRAVAAELACLGELSDVARATTTVPPSALTGREQRLLCVILARPAPDSSRDVAPVSIAATMTPEEATGEVDAVRSAIARFGGRLEVLLDGSIVVTLAGAGAATDQAGRAARCALALRAIVPDVPIALATGRGVMGAGWPVGEAIDRAASLLAGRAGGLNVRLDEVTAGLLDARFDVARGVAALELVGEREAIEAQGTVLGLTIPCIGRDRELGLLDGMLERCIDDQAAQAVVITAGAGAGKSRIARELVGRARRKGELEVLVARGDPMSAGSPFGMLAGAIRRTAGIQNGEPLEVQQHKLRDRVARCVRPDDVTRVTEFLGEMVGVRFPDDERVELRTARRDAMFLGDQMRRAFEDWLEAELVRAPVLLVLEDLHWGDLPSVKFVDAALRNLQDRPFMVLALGRPEVHETFPKLWAERSVHEIRLSPLSRKHGVELVRRVLGPGVSDARVARLVELGAGNPFYLEELVRAVASGRKDDLPGTVLAMVQSRLEGLEGGARRVLRAASVFGQVFWKSGVLALLGGDERTTQGGGWLSELVNRELIERRRSSSFPGEDELVFRNALVRDAAYATLTEADRALGHRLAGAWLERAGERDAVVLAEHFERGGEPSRAVVWYQRAAEQAFGGNDFEASLARAERAVACLRASAGLMAPSAGSEWARPARTLIAGEALARAEPAKGDVLGALCLLQAEAHKWRGDFAEAAGHAAEAMRLLEAGTPRWYSACGELALASGRLGRHEVLVATARDLGDRAAQRASEPRQIVATARVAVELFVAGRAELGDALLDRIARAGADVIQREPAVAARIAGARAFRALTAGDPGLSGALEEVAAQAYERAGDVRNACLARSNGGYACVEVGAYADAERGLRETLRAAERMGLRNVAAAARQHLGRALAHLGALAEAREVQRAAIAVFATNGDRRMEAGSRIALAELELAAGALGAAESEARGAVDAVLAIPATRAYALAMLGRVLLARRALPEALAAAGEGAAILGSLGGIDDGEALVRLVHAEALHEVGRGDEARAAIGAARDRLTERAAAMADSPRRRGFLEIVPENARTFELAGSLGAAPSPQRPAAG